jgi:hypothetical protein
LPLCSARPLIHFIQASPTDIRYRKVLPSLDLFLERQCDRALPEPRRGRPKRAHVREMRPRLTTIPLGARPRTRRRPRRRRRRRVARRRRARRRRRRRRRRRPRRRRALNRGPGFFHEVVTFCKPAAQVSDLDQGRLSRARVTHSRTHSLLATFGDSCVTFRAHFPCSRLIVEGLLAGRMVQRVHTNSLCELADRCGTFVLARSDPDTAFLFQAQRRGSIHYTIISMNKSPQFLKSAEHHMVQQS